MRLGKAQARYDDWVGSIAVDDDLEMLYGAAEISVQEWHICGVAVEGEGSKVLLCRVFAVPSDAIKSYDDWARLAEEGGGSVRVSEFRVPEQNLVDLPFAAGVRRWSMHLTLGKALAHSNIDVSVEEAVSAIRFVS